MADFMNVIGIVIMVCATALSLAFMAIAVAALFGQRWARQRVEGLPIAQLLATLFINLVASWIGLIITSGWRIHAFAEAAPVGLAFWGAWVFFALIRGSALRPWTVGVAAALTVSCSALATA